MQTIDLKGACLSPQQIHLWHWLQEKQQLRVQGAFEITGELKPGVLEQALQQVVDHHEILRTTFTYVPGMELPMQVLGKHIEISCPVVDLGHLSIEAQQGSQEGYWHELLQRPFNLEHGPLLHAIVLHLSSQSHVLILSLHALCADASTLKLLGSAILQTYSAPLHGGGEVDDPLQYVNVTAWLNELLQDEAEESFAYWRTLDLSHLNSIRLPFEGSKEGVYSTENRSAQTLFEQRQITIPVPLTLQQRLKIMSQEREVSIEAVLLAVWQILLWRLTDNPDVLVGMLYDGRPYEELTDLLGPYACTVPIGLSLTESSSFAWVLRQVQQMHQRSREKQLYFTWESVVANEHERPYFPITFAYEVCSDPVPCDPLTISLLRQEYCLEPSQLQLHVWQSGKVLQLQFVYDVSVFSEGQVRHLASMFVQLLNAAIDQPEVPISSLSLLTQAQQIEQEERLRGPERDWPFVPLHRLFEEQVRRQPNAAALRCGPVLLSYEQLEQQANQLAHILLQQGLLPGGQVALCLPRDHWTLVGLLAVLKAGGVYVPLDMQMPTVRLRSLLNQLAPDLVLSSQLLQDQLPSLNVPVVYVEELSHQLTNDPCSPPQIEVGPEDLVYVMYTSGSTGVPKGVQIRQWSVSNYTQAMCELLELQAGWHFATVSSLAADLGNTSIFCGLASGGCVHILSYEQITDATAFSAYVEQYPLDVLKIVPTHLQTLLMAGTTGIVPRERLILGGEALSWSLVEQLQQLAPSCQLYNHYGPTEATIGTLVQPLGAIHQIRIPASERRGPSVPIGHPLANTQAYLLDERRQWVPNGVVGELYLAGTGLAAGYQPASTQGGFLELDLAGKRQRLYKTGDWVREREPGVLEFVGRRDEQVKLRGYRIEVGEIEAALRQHPQVWDCVVLLQEKGPVGPRLIGYVVARMTSGLTSEALGETLKQSLPAYMVPSTFVLLEALPLTSNGKVDRRQLPQPEQVQTRESVMLATPRSPLEDALLTMWQDLLALPMLGIHDNFFAVGGHSLLATRLIAQIRAVLQVELPVKAVFDAPTVAALAQRIEQALHEDEVLPQPPLVARARPEEVPLSYAQQRLWFLDQLEPGSTTYLVPSALNVRGAVDVQHLEQVLQELISRHESLRTTFEERSGQPVQIIHPASRYTLPVIDLQPLGQEQREREAQHLASQEAQRPCDLVQGPLLRTSLLRLEREAYVLLLTLHHSITDGWSNGVFVRELVTLYRSQIAGQPSPLAPLPIQYADYALWQRGWLQGEVLEAHLAYWRAHLAEMPALEMPTDHPRPAVQTSRGAVQSLWLPVAVLEELVALSQQEHVTLFMTLLAAFQVLLQRYSGQDDFSVGTPIANRGHAEIEGVIGFFVNTLVLRANLSGNPSFREMLLRVREACLGAYAHQDVPFEQVVEALAPTRDLSRSPLFQVALALQNTPQEQEDLADVHVKPLPVEQVISKFDLTLWLSETEDGLSCTLEYNTDLFEAQTITQLLGHWQTLLEGIVHHPQARLWELPLLTTAEHELILEQWNATATSYPQDVSIHQLIEQQAERTPDALALVFEERALTYAELNRRANQLAHHLLTLDVGPDVLVGVCMQRSIEIVLALLAILKAGGAYVPLDPTFPDERLASLLEDCHTPIILTQEHLRSRLPAGKTLCLDTQWEEQIRPNVSGNPDRLLAADQLAYLIYTSGSTGHPKGVMNTHRGLRNRLLWMQQTYGLTPSDRVLQKTPFSFDVSVWEFFWPLFTGACLVVAIPAGHQDPTYLKTVLEEQQITTVHFVPAMLQSFLQEPGIEACSSVRQVISSGEALTTEVQTRFFARFSAQVGLHNLYGPTEASIDVTSWACQPDEEAGTVPIGRPIANTQIYLLDRTMRPVPRGVIGDLYIGGVGLARGYHGRADLTAERFPANPFACHEGDRLYKTGDLARFRRDGAIEYIGRSDQQVKLRGYRIELGEIEAIFNQHAVIEKSLVMVNTQLTGEPQLVAYLVPDRTRARTVWKLLEMEKSGLLNLQKTLQLPNAMTVAYLNKSETMYLYQEIFAEQTYQHAGITFRPGDCIFDVGANIGFFSLFAQNICRDATIYAFEPLPPIYDVLRINADLYGPNIRAFACGLADTARQDVFTYYPYVSMVSGRYAEDTDVKKNIVAFLQNERQKEGYDPALQDELLEERLRKEQYLCQLRTISEIIREEGVECINLLKIDVEESELEVLAGIAEEDWSKIRQVIIEVHDLDGRLDTITTLLQNHGFLVSQRQETALYNTDLYNLYAVREIAELTRPSDQENMRLGEDKIIWPSTTAIVQEVRGWLSKKLPPYMMPAHYLFLNEWPLTSSGKVDRRALPLPKEVQDEKLIAPEEGRTPIEELLIGLWKKVLGRAHIGIHDNFFEVGGHSLLSMQLIARVRAILGVEMPLRAVFEAPTVASFAQWVELALRKNEEREIPPLVVMERPAMIPLSYAQQRLWFLEQLEPGSTTYLVPQILSVRGEIEIHALEWAFQELTTRHESLRTTFIEQNGQPIQVIHPEANLSPLFVIDLQGLEKASRQEHVRHLAKQEKHHPCDLMQGSLLRTSLLCLEKQEHVLLLTLHHIITDGWSNGVLVHDLMILYRSFVAGQLSPLEPLPLQYADYALWQRGWLHGEVLEAHLAYWRAHLAQVPLLEMPTDHPRPAVQAFRGAIQLLHLPVPVSKALEALSQQEHVTLFMTLLAAFQVLLQRYSGQDDFGVGTPIANRGHAEIEGLIGFFVNTLVLRTDLSGNPTFTEMLQRVREICLGAYAHQDVPFEQVVEALAPTRDLSRSPLFQVMLVLQNIPQEHGQDDLAGMRMESLTVESTVSKFDLTLSLSETENGLVGTLEYNTDLFEAETITRLLSHWQTLLEGIVHHPQAHLADLPLLTAEEHTLQLEHWNATATPYPQNLCVHQLFEEQVQRTPDAVALVFEDETLTYACLNRRANQLAHHLQTLGVGPDVLVGIGLERCIEMVLALLAVLKAGGAYVPLDPQYPEDRLAFMIADAHIHLLLTHQRFHALFASSPVQQIWLDAESEALTHLSDDPVESGVRMENLLYVIYTSGSTGRPKGVMISHRALGNHMHWMHDAFPLTPGERLLQKTSFSFDASVWEVYAPLLCGASLILATPEGPKDSRYLIQVLKEQAITQLKLVPSLLRVLLEEPDFAHGPILQHVFCGGEALSTALATRFFAAGSGQLHNLYGPTETTIDVTFWQCQPEETGVRLPIGRPIANTQTFILDEACRPVPVGVVGELYIAGIGVARGYMGRPDLTAEKFLPHPFAQDEGSRLYKTGDQVRYRADGVIEYLGRMDQQVKIRGYRIELGEIEAVLREHPLVQDAVVLAREDVPGDTHLVAYVVLHAGQTLTMRVLRTSLQDRLPMYMLPAHMVVLDALPLTSSGKLDRKALPAPTWERSHDAPTFLAPRSAIEKTLATIWEEVLHTKDIGIQDNFFERGGDSIISIQIIARARQQGLRFTLKQLFQYQTIEQLSHVVDAAALVQAEQGLVLGSLPLTPIQRRFFELDLVRPQHWNQALFFEIMERLRGSLLEQVVRAWLSQHDTLRLRFRSHADGWSQSLAELEGPIPCLQIDLSALRQEDQEGEATYLAGQTQASLDLSEGPLVRVVLFERGRDQAHLLLLVIHHLAVDGVSWRILLEDLSQAYQQVARGEKIVLPAKTSSFKAWAEHVQAYVHSVEMQQEQTFWLNQIGEQVRALPRDLNGQENTVASAWGISNALTVEETRALLEEVPAIYHTQINEVLLTALTQTLGAWMGSREVLIDLEGHGREDLFVDVDLSRTVGWFTSIFPMYLTLGETSSVAQAIQGVKEHLQTIPNHGIGYGILRYLSRDPVLVEQLRAQPQAEVSFNYLGQLDQIGSSPGVSSLLAGASRLSAGLAQSGYGRRAYLLDITCQVSGNQFQATWNYGEGIHRRATIERLASAFMEALRAIIQQSQSSDMGDYSPLDFPNVELSSEQIEQIMKELDFMEEIADE